MSVWDIRIESEEVCFGGTSVSLHKILEPVNYNPSEGMLHTHCYYELHLIVQGSYTYRIKDASIQVNAGELLIIKPEHVHRAVVQKNGVQIVILGLSLKALQPCDSFYPYFVKSLDDNASVPLCLPRPLFHNFISYSLLSADSSIRSLCHRKLEACEVIVRLFELIGSDSVVRSEAAPTGFDIVLETLIQNPEITLQEIAVRMGYSQRQLSRKIKEKYAMTFRQLRKEIKENETTHCPL